MYLVTVSLFNDLSMKALIDELGIRTLFVSQQEFLGAGHQPGGVVSFIVRDGHQLAPVLKRAIRESFDGSQGWFFFVTPVLIMDGWPVALGEDDALPDPGTARIEHYQALGQREAQ